jgi:hypothetical protein
MTVIIIELLKIIISVLLDLARQSKMSDEQLKAYRQQVDDIFMSLPSAKDLPPPPPMGPGAPQS